MTYKLKLREYYLVTQSTISEIDILVINSKLSLSKILTP